MTLLINWIFIALMFIGLFFILTASLGIWRFPDVYTRLHAASKGTTFGFGFIILGAAFLSGDPLNIAKAFLAISFLFLEASVSAHMMANIALKKGHQPVIDSNGTIDPEKVFYKPSADSQASPK